MRFHVLGVPHTVTHKDYLACAFTQKVIKFCKMMSNLGYEIIHYGNENSIVQCTEHVTVTTENDLIISYGNYDWKKNLFKYDPRKDYVYKVFEKNTLSEIRKRGRKNDFVLAFFGLGHQNVCNKLDPETFIVVEPGIGYTSTFAPYRVFESYALYHAIVGPTIFNKNNKSVNYPNWYDAVIPNYFDLEDFEFNDKKDDYFLYLGRIVIGKGIDIALDVTKEIGAKLILAGQMPIIENSNPFTDMITNLPDHAEFVGYADVDKRKKLMRNAKAGLVPSRYVEPFGGVQIEMLLSGTPTITTDWGAFAENNLHNLTGYRCRTFNQFKWAAENIDLIKPIDCRNWGENFSLEKIALMYQDYFNSLLDYHKSKSWYNTNTNLTNLNWLNKNYFG